MVCRLIGLTPGLYNMTKAPERILFIETDNVEFGGMAEVGRVFIDLSTLIFY